MYVCMYLRIYTKHLNPSLIVKYYHDLAVYIQLHSKIKKRETKILNKHFYFHLNDFTYK